MISQTKKKKSLKGKGGNVKGMVKDQNCNSKSIESSTTDRRVKRKNDITFLDLTSEANSNTEDSLEHKQKQPRY
jgi:hypothetical protein